MGEMIVRPMNGGNGIYSYSKNSNFQVQFHSIFSDILLSFNRCALIVGN